MSTAAPSAAAASRVRVLSRQPPSSQVDRTASSTPTDGVAAVGFVGDGVACCGAARLVDRLLDARIFGAGGSAKTLSEPLSGVAYHYDAEKKVVFLLFSPRVDVELPGLLFMFLVCHVIIFVHNHAHFDLGLLKKFRLLQTSKQVLAPYVQKQLGLSKTSLRAVQQAPSISPPLRRSGACGRIALMSRSTSHLSLLPGHCSPVVLFVFVDDFFDSLSNCNGIDDPADLSCSMDGLPKSATAQKSSGPVGMFARPSGKSDRESNLKKKLQSSIEAQVRSLIKKCRILAGAELSHVGSRTPHNFNHFPLFSLDASRAVILLDRTMYQKGEPLGIITGLVEDSLCPNASLDLLELESNSQPIGNEDVQSIKEFIFRHTDALRGRGSLSGNAPTSGAGMVAVAAAAAAASAAAGKPVSAPSLLNFENWLSISSNVLSVLLSKQSCSPESIEGSQQGNINVKGGPALPERENVVKAALANLNSGKDLNRKFSISWCERALPDAREVYLKDLPSLYTTKVHKWQAEKALQYFHSMVRGPAVQEYAKKLRDECELIWESGRQQCDAVSLTGKPCIHKRHDLSTSSLLLSEHSSGCVFLRACACGWSQRPRDDPFDFESANLTFNCLPDCEDLPSLEISAGNNEYSLPVVSWRLMRLGGSIQYNSVEGLLQPGFDSKKKHLSRWTISSEKQTNGQSSNTNTVKTSLASSMDNTSSSPTDIEHKIDSSQVQKEVEPPRYDNQRKQAETEGRKNPGVSFGRGFPSVTMKKAFADVVAGTAIRDSEFPALQPKKPPKPISRKDEKQLSAVKDNNEHGPADTSQGPPQTEIAPKEESTKWKKIEKDAKPFLQIGSNIVPFDAGIEAKSTKRPPLQFSVYIGFEHECSYGHRFLLSDELLKELDADSLPYGQSSRTTNGSLDTRNKSTLQEVSTQNVVGPTMHASPSNIANGGSIKSSGINIREFNDGRSQKLLPVHDKKLESYFQHMNIDDVGEALSLLNRNLPLYMPCPYCRNVEKEGHRKSKYASTVSQLQRIFIVTPDYPILLAACPVLQFADFCLPDTTVNRAKQSQFSLSRRVMLPPDSFVTMTLPFIYGVKIKDGNILPLKYCDQRPEHTAWLVGGTTLEIVSVGTFSD